MTFRTWREVDKILAEATGPATARQLEMARLTGTPMADDTPTIVAGVLLRAALAGELGLPAPRPLSGRYDSRLRILRRRSDPRFVPSTEEEAEAWVAHLRLVRRRENLRKLAISEGDIVRTADGNVAEVSSIDDDGRVFFKGGRGFGSWPDLLSVVARSGDRSRAAISARQHAQNTASQRTSSPMWSGLRSRDLQEFMVRGAVSEDDIAELESVVTLAKDERPIQRLLGQNPHLLTALLGGDLRYCVPQKRLGAEYVPDFIIGDVDSRGIRWVLIELETPRTGVYLRDGLRLDAATRRGVDQVIGWRNWLASNVAYARQRPSENGLGLFDIREKADALVFVGRRSRMPETKDAARHEYYQSNGILIHTYDWLLGTLRGIIAHRDPSAANPYLLRRHKEEAEDTSDADELVVLTGLTSVRL